MNAQKAKAIRKFIKENMGLDPKKDTMIYEQLKKAVQEQGAVLPNTNYKVGDRVEFTFENGNKKTAVVSKINGYSRITGELFMILTEEATGIGINSVYDKNRKKL